MELVDGRRTPWPCVPAEEVIFLSSSTHDLWAIRDSGLCSLHKKRDGFHVGSPTQSIFFRSKSDQMIEHRKLNGTGIGDSIFKVC